MPRALGEVVDSLPSVQAAYLAGIIDGEGSVFIDRKKDKTMIGGYGYWPRITVGMTDKPVIEWIRKVVGAGGVILESSSSLKYKDCWRWEVWSRQVGKLLPLVLPYLTVKRPQADIVLALSDLIRGLRGTALTEDERTLRVSLYQEVTAMNHRGVDPNKEEIGRLKIGLPVRRDRNMLPITDEQAAYIAGLIDGEGSVAIVRGKRSESLGGYSYGPYVDISNTNRPLIDWLYSTTGLGGIVPGSNGRLSPANWKPGWRWVIQSQSTALAILVRTLPYLIAKKERARIVVAFVDSRKGGPMYKGLSKEERDTQEVLYDRVRMLNKRGR